jgi:16S rRNA (adenine1518-N6/adenine1519-N6)-dimethyltransferase
LLGRVSTDYKFLHFSCRSLKVSLLLFALFTQMHYRIFMVEKFEHKKSLGQHFLNSDYVPNKMCTAGAVSRGDIVLEIGPGTGVLTRELLARGAIVIAVEADYRAISALETSFSEAIAKQQLILHHHDARKLNPSDFGLQAQKFKVISNIPYYLSGLLFRSLLDTDCQPSTLVFLIQKELAERIARDKKESLMSLSIKLFGDSTYICTIKRSHFSPPPKVDSAIILVNNISHRRLNNLPADFIFDILRLGFGQKRKQLLGNLTQKYLRQQVQSIFRELLIKDTARAEELPWEIWVKLCYLLHKSTNNTNLTP